MYWLRCYKRNMGSCLSKKPRHFDGTLLRDPFFEVEGSVGLVRRGDPEAFVFTNAARLEAGERDVPLTLSRARFPGKAVVAKWSYPKKRDVWRYIHLGFGDAADALRVTKIPGEAFISIGKYVFDVTDWKYEIGNQISLISHIHGDGRQVRNRLRVF